MQKKGALLQAVKAQVGSRGIALLFLKPRRYMRVGWLTTRRPASPPVNETRYPLYRMLVGRGRGANRSEPMWKISSQPEFFVFS